MIRKRNNIVSDEEFLKIIEPHGKEFKERQNTLLGLWLGDYIAKFLWGLC